MSDPVQLEEKSKASKKSKKSNKSKTNEVPETNSKNNNEEGENNYQNQGYNEPVLSTRAYLEQNVTQVVQEALLNCARERPPNPLKFVGEYILNRANGQ